MAWKNRNRIFLVAMLVSVAVLYNTFESKDFKKKVHRIKSIQEPPYISPSIYLPPRPILTSEQRISNLKIQCSDRNQSWAKLTRNETKLIGRHVIVNDKHKTLYCYIPKVACTNWKNVLRELEEAVNYNFSKNVHLFPFKYLFDYSKSEIEHRLQTYYKFMFVREPLERLVSAYRDKFKYKYDVWPWSKYIYHIKRILMRIHRNSESTWHRYEKTERLTLTEFFSYVTNVSPLDMNEHWMPYEQLCQPCAISYDFIGSLDNLQQDAKRVLSHLGVQDKVQFPVKQSKYLLRSRNNTFDSLVSQVPKPLLTEIVKVYFMDYRLFSFPVPPEF